MATAPTFPFVVTWLDNSTTVVPLAACSNHGRILESTVDVDSMTPLYLTHPADGDGERPASSVGVPPQEIELTVSASMRGGVTLSLWVLQFKGEEQIEKTSWPVQGDRTVTWKPHPECQSVRLALRLAGTGTLESAQLIARERGSEARATEQLMAVWRSLNAPKSTLVGASIDAPTECPTQLGPQPTAIGWKAAATDPRLRELGIDGSKISLDGGIFDEPRAPQAVWSHLQRALVEGAYDWTCPFTGAPIRSSDTFLVSEPSGRPYVFVRFESAGRVVFLILCPYSSSRAAAYFPREELVVTRPGLGNLIPVLRGLVVKHAAEVQRYLTTAERKTLIPLNTMSHWGHLMLNEIDAIQWVFDSGNDARVDLWLEGDVEFADVARAFALPAARHRMARSVEDRFRACLHENAYVVRPQIASYRLGERAGMRLVDVWKREGEATGSSAQIAAQLAGRFPVIWCEIRVIDRLWKNHLDGLAAIVEALSPRYPNLTLVFAGWSRMPEKRAEDERMIAIESKAIESMMQALPGTHCIPIVGVSTGDKVRWAFGCHFHLTLFGSGMIFPLLARLPGVTVTSRYYQQNELCIGDRERQLNFMFGVENVVVVPVEHITDDTSIENGEVRDFSADPAAVAALVGSELSKIA